MLYVGRLKSPFPCAKKKKGKKEKEKERKRPSHTAEFHAYCKLHHIGFLG
jgi:hypothetical protein